MTNTEKRKTEIYEKYEKEFSDRLRHLRNERKLSAREMSIALGQNVNYVNLIENGKRFPSMQGFFALCDYLKISPSSFFESDNFLQEKEKLKSEKEELFDILNTFSSSQITAILELIKAFKI